MKYIEMRKEMKNGKGFWRVVMKQRREGGQVKVKISICYWDKPKTEYEEEWKKDYGASWTIEQYYEKYEAVEYTTNVYEETREEANVRYLNLKKQHYGVYKSA